MNLFIKPATWYISIVALVLCTLSGCKKGITQQEDELYSKHLQHKVKLTVIATPLPDDKSEINLLVFNDGQVLDQLNIKDIVDSLYSHKRIAPLVIVGIHANNRIQEYGIAEKSAKAPTGGKSDHYDSFFNNELYPYAKKKAGVRRFKTIVMAGFGAGGLSALDIAWNHPDKISKAGVFSGALSRKEKNVSDTGITSKGMMYEKLEGSRKRPKLQFWFYAGSNGNTDIPGDDTKDIAGATYAIVELLNGKKFTSNADIVFIKGATNDSKAWRNVLPDFVEWAVGR